MRLLCDVSRHSHVALPGHLLLLVLYVMDFNSCEELLEVLRSMVCGFVPPPGVLCSWLVPAPWEVHQPSRNTSWIAVLTSGPWVMNSPFWSVGWIWGQVWPWCRDRALLCVLPRAVPCSQGLLGTGQGGLTCPQGSPSPGDTLGTWAVPWALWAGRCKAWLALRTFVTCAYMC